MKKLVVTAWVTLSLLLGASEAWAGKLKEGITAVGRQDFGHARDVLEDYVSKFPNDPRPYYYLSKCYESWYDVSKVSDMLRAYQRLNAQRQQVLQHLEGADPIPTYRAMLKDDPEDIAAHMLLVVALLEAGARDMALAELQAIPASSVPTELGDVWHAMWGTVCQLNGDLDKARAEFKECWRLNANNPLPPVRLAEIDKAERDRQNAQQQAIFDHGDGSGARSFELTLKLGKDLLTEGNFDGAIDALQQALVLKPQSTDAKQALNSAQQKSAEVQYQKGVQFMREQKYASAYDLFMAASKLDPQNLKAQIAAKDAKSRADQAQQDMPRNP